MGLAVLLLAAVSLLIIQLLAPMSAAEYEKFGMIIAQGDPAGATLEAFIDEHNIGLWGWYLRPAQYYVALSAAAVGLFLGLALVVVGYRRRSGPKLAAIRDEHEEPCETKEPNEIG